MREPLNEDLMVLILFVIKLYSNCSSKAPLPGYGRNQVTEFSPGLDIQEHFFSMIWKIIKPEGIFQV